MKIITVGSLILCTLLISCVSTPPPSVQENAIIQHAREDLVRGDYDWIVHDMEKYLQNYSRSSLAAEAYLLLGEATKGQIDTARKEKNITGMILTTYTAPLIQKAYENYMLAAEEAINDQIASEALFKAAVILDIGYMKIFDKALVVYGDVIKKFPGTTWAERAQVRYDNLSGKFRSLQSGPHKIPVQ
jgi:TolA-binding protein